MLNHANLSGDSPPVDLYFVRMDVADRPIKIGRSAATGARFRMLQCGSPYKLECIGLVYGEGAWEPTWHSRFDKQRMCGEWFMPSDELEAAIEVAVAKGSREALGYDEPLDWRAALGIPPPPRRSAKEWTYEQFVEDMRRKRAAKRRKAA